jgi:hypothetical protein
MKECTFKPKLNRKAVLSPSKKYRYYGYKSSTVESYSKEKHKKDVERERDVYQLYGKYARQLGKCIPTILINVFWYRFQQH